MIKTYYLLTKPGIILGNLITTAGGFALASKGRFDLALFCWLLLGLGPVIASACVFNNAIDREIDRKMARTKNRPLASGALSLQSAVIFAVLLGVIGIAVLALFTNPLAVTAAALGFFIYVAMYSFWKTKTRYATLIGSIAGALPPVIGYLAAKDALDSQALLLFAILILWQMPHFYSIAMSRLADYAAAEIPVLPVTNGNGTTKVRMLAYIIAFFIAMATLIAIEESGTGYLFFALLLSLPWLWLSLRGFKAEDDEQWARQMFRVSLLVITAFSAMVVIKDGIHFVQ